MSDPVTEREHDTAINAMVNEGLSALLEGPPAHEKAQAHADNVTNSTEPELRRIREREAEILSARLAAHADAAAKLAAFKAKDAPVRVFSG